MAAAYTQILLVQAVMFHAITLLTILTSTAAYTTVSIHDCNNRS
eukprot:COSAG02_NODE_8167_length_2681_cov_2.087529_1_plen_44_part_00